MMIPLMMMMMITTDEDDDHTNDDALSLSNINISGIKNP